MEPLTDKQKYVLYKYSSFDAGYGSHELDLPLKYIDGLTKFKASRLIGEIMRLQDLNPDKYANEWEQLSSFKAIQKFINQGLDEDFDPKSLEKGE